MTTRLRGCGSRWQLGARLTSGPDGMSPRRPAMLACKQRRPFALSPTTQVPALPFCRGGIDRDDWASLAACRSWVAAQGCLALQARSDGAVWRNGLCGASPARVARRARCQASPGPCQPRPHASPGPCQPRSMPAQVHASLMPALLTQRQPRCQCQPQVPLGAVCCLRVAPSTVPA
jgi:hypothetical protein